MHACTRTHVHAHSPDALRPLRQMDSTDKPAYTHCSVHCDICYTSILDTLRTHTHAHVHLCESVLRTMRSMMTGDHDLTAGQIL